MLYVSIKPVIIYRANWQIVYVNFRPCDTNDSRLNVMSFVKVAYINVDSCELGAIQVLRNAIFLEIGPPPTPS